MSFSQGISGLNAASVDLDIIGNNIANAQTNGFKAARGEFADMFAGALAGIGTRVTGSSQDFGKGTITSTGRDLDMAIDGNGFFRLQQDGQTVYSRNGSFHVDADGFIVNSDGGKLTGFPFDQIGSDPGPIQISNDTNPPHATTDASTQYNLDAGAKVGDTNKQSFTVYDSLGNAHTVTLQFTKTAENTWTAQPTLNDPGMDKPIDLGGPQTLTFDQDGKMVSPTGAFNISIPAADLKTGAADMNFGLNLAGSTQYARDFSNTTINQDGYTSGDLTRVEVDKQGHVIGHYSNNQTKTLATIPLVTFRNNNGLQPVGNNAWQETSDSGQPLLGSPGSGQLGEILGQSLESSNVNLSNELVNMIVAQRNYQANSQTIKTQDQIMQTLISLR